MGFNLSKYTGIYKISKYVVAFLMTTPIGLWIYAQWNGLELLEKYALISLFLAGILASGIFILLIIEVYFPRNKRMPVSDILNKASMFGWDINNPDRCELCDFSVAIEQSAQDGSLEVWGKSSYELSNKAPVWVILRKIPTDHWNMYCVAFGKNPLSDNFNIRTYKGESTAYKDLHVVGANAGWIIKSKKQFQGKTRKDVLEAETN